MENIQWYIQMGFCELIMNLKLQAQVSLPVDQAQLDKSLLSIKIFGRTTHLYG